MAHKYKRHFGKAEREQRKALFDEARSIMKQVENTEQYIVDDLLSKTQVITATLVGANHYTIFSTARRCDEFSEGVKVAVASE